MSDRTGLSSGMPPAIVLVGGRGARLGPATADMPKPMLCVAGKPFLHWVTAWLLGQGVTEIVFATGHSGEKVADWVATLDLPGGVSVLCRQEEAPLGTGGALLFALQAVHPDYRRVLVLNGDSLLLCDLSALVARYDEGGADAVLAALAVDDALRYGALDIDLSGRITAFGEKRPGGGWINGGVYLFSRALLGRFPANAAMSIEYDLIPQALGAGSAFFAFKVTAPFIDIGTPETLAAASAFIERHGGLIHSNAGGMSAPKPERKRQTP
ncbi:MAG: sugar phosphate nucleotidyltransferase [Pseudomonadota bacterium]